MRKFLAITMILTMIVAACSTDEATKESPPQTPARDAEYLNPQLLVDVDWVENSTNNPTVVLVDLRSQDTYSGGHIPNAVQLDLSLLRANVDGVAGQVVSPEIVARVLGDHGIAPNDTVVAYDDVDNLDAARFFWTLEYFGHDDVRLLDGGWPAWENSSYTISTDTAEPEAVTYSVQTQPEKRVDAEWVLANLDNASVVLVDARSPSEYEGEDVRAAEGGHIPGAYNRDWHLNLKDGYFKGQESLEALYQEMNLAEAETIVAYCQTGHRASVAYFTLRLIGYENVAVYDGSWEEWGNRDDVPHVVGTEPESEAS